MTVQEVKVNLTNRLSYYKQFMTEIHDLMNDSSVPIENRRAYRLDKIGEVLVETLLDANDIQMVLIEGSAFPMVRQLVLDFSKYLDGLRYTLNSLVSIERGI